MNETDWKLSDMTYRQLNLTEIVQKNTKNDVNGNELANLLKNGA